MSFKNDAPNENINDVLERLRQSYSDDAMGSVIEDDAAPTSDKMSEDELKERLRMQFMAEAEAEAELDKEDSYVIDEDFLNEAEAEDEYEDDELTFDEIEEIEDENDPETETIELAEEEDDELTFDDIEEIEDENDPETVTIELAEEEDDELTFDDIEEIEDENDPETETIELVEEEDDDLTFDEIEEIKDENGSETEEVEIPAEDTEFILPDIDDVDEVTDISDAVDNSVNDSDITEEANDIDDVPWYEDDEMPAAKDADETEPELMSANVEEVSHEEEFVALEEFIDDLFTVQVTETPTAVPEPPAMVDGEFLDGLFANGDAQTATSDSVILDTLAKTEPDGAEISLLLQLGCDDEVMDRYDKESLDKMSTEETLKSIAQEEKERQKQTAEEKIHEYHEFYKKTRGSLLIRLIINAVLAIVFMFYEGIPAFGNELSGILNRDDYSVVPYVLIGISLLLIAVITSYKELWSGIKKLFSPVPNLYSMVSLLTVSVLVYDISILFVDKGTPPTFHFVVILAFILAIVREYLAVTAERRSFEFFFTDVVDENSVTKRFTLCRSEGKGSTAEKMYAGGLESDKTVYFPLEIDSEVGFFRAIERGSIKTDVSMLLLVPAITLSLIAGIFALFVSGQVWVAFGGMSIALFMTLPVATVAASRLPFERLSSTFRRCGYAFAGETSVDEYADGDSMIFSDMHMFAKCAPSSVNLALYDSTARDILLGCLGAVYSEIGGPMSETFAAAKSSRFEGCRITRVGKSGVEAIVGKSYSVLLGNEAFMSRYGISFPKVNIKNPADEVFILCVSINGRATARIAVRYSVNEVFEMFVQRLAEDGVGCVIETFDPMISGELLERVRPNAKAPVSIVHLGVEDYCGSKKEKATQILFDAYDSELGVSAHGSRFNLVVAMSAAKRMKKLHKLCNLLSFGFCGLGALIALAAAGFGWINGFNSFIIMLWWAISFGAIALLTWKLLPGRERFSFEHFKSEREQEQ